MATTAPTTSTPPKDESNPYFTFDPAKCIVCSRCVRACERQQGTFALTIEGRGFDAKISPSAACFPRFGVCVLRRLCAGLPDRDADRESRDRDGQPSTAVVTTCAYCGVGCAFKAEMQGERSRAHGAGQGRQGEPRPLLREGPLRLGLRHPPRPHHQPDDPREITDPWREVSWEEAIAARRREFKRIQARHGRDSIGGITSSRCTNEETYLVQKLVRAGFGNNNVDTCARVCHSPTGYGLKTDLRHSAGTQDFDSVDAGGCRRGHRRQPDRRPSGLRLAHEAAASRGRPTDRDRSAPHRPGEARRTSRPKWPPAAAPGHERRACQRAGPRHRHRRLVDEAFVASVATCSLRALARVHRRRSPLAGSHRIDHRRAGASLRGAARLYATGGNAPSTTASASPSTARARRW
jgi:formate dehydrogenase major subunit